MVVDGRPQWSHQHPTISEAYCVASLSRTRATQDTPNSAIADPWCGQPQGEGVYMNRSNGHSPASAFSHPITSLQLLTQLILTAY